MATDPIRPGDLAPLEALFSPAYPQTLRDLATSLFMELLDRSSHQPHHPGRGPRLAQLALALTNRLSADFGGNNLYMHKALSHHLTERNREMYALYDNKRWTYKTLGKKYGLTEVQVRNIIQACIEEEVSRRQGRLPGLDDDEGSNT